MPRWASRIDLDITGVRVQRVQQISCEDARAEGTEVYCFDCNGTGVEQIPCGSGETRCEFCDGTGRYPHEFRKLWDSLNAKRGFGWDANPWVWVYEFAQR
jgi:hypothetical protein